MTFCQQLVSAFTYKMPEDYEPLTIPIAVHCVGVVQASSRQFPETVSDIE